MNRYTLHYTEKQSMDNAKAIQKLESELLELRVKVRKLDSELRSYLEDKITELTSIPQKWELDIKHDCHIYFIRSLDKVKIGYSKNPGQRLMALQTANPNPLELLYSFPSFKHREEEIHRDLSEHHVHLEWFKYNDDVKNYIDELRNNPK